VPLEASSKTKRFCESCFFFSSNIPVFGTLPRL